MAPMILIMLPIQKKLISFDTDELNAIVVLLILQMLCQKVDLLLSELKSLSAFGHTSNLLFDRSLVRL